MYLKRLELLGFKSFAARTVFELDQGMTAVVGPNGSGKSNVADAVRWALGEQSLRAVRSRKSEEVIFSGNARRSAVGMAEVTLVFDNSDGIFPVPFAEVSITRRQYRSGEGEYLINKARGRLKDVVELLTHVNLGPDGYAVVGQGAVDEVLLLRPEERRSLLEVAADITRYQLKVRESLDKLKETEGNIQRAEDIRGELSPRLSKLRTQANRAQQHDKLVRRLRAMLQWRYLLQLRHSRQEAMEDLGLEKRCAEVVLQATRALEASRQRVAQLREREREEESRLEASRERQNALRLARAASERETALMQERESAYRRQVEGGEEELARARKESQELETELGNLTTVRSKLVACEAAAKAEVTPVEAEWRKASSERRLIEAQLERLTGEQQGLARRRSELQERRNALLRESRRAEEVLSESRKAEEEANLRLAKLEEQLAPAQEEMDQLRAELAEAEAHHKGVQARLKVLADELQAAHQAEREAWEQDNDLQNRLTILQSLREERRGVPSGAKVILKAGLPGIRGTLASMIRVPREYVTAIAAALGGAQGYVVVENFQEGLEALNLLSKESGRATIAPLRLDKKESPVQWVEEFRSSLEGLLEGIAFRGLAPDLVSCQGEARDLCTRYLGLSLIVEDMSDALELHRRLTQLTEGRLAFQTVTMDGRVVRARGDLVSAQSEGREGGLLARENELQSLSKLADKARTRLQKAREAVVGLEARQSELTWETSADSAAVSRLQGEIAKRSSTHAELASRTGKLEGSIEWHRSRAAAAEREAAHSQEGLAKAEKELGEIATREAEMREKVGQLRSDLEIQQSVVAEVGARLSRLQSEVSSAQGQLRELEARVSAVSEAFQRAEARVKRQEEKLLQLSQALGQLAEGPRAVFPPSLEEELRATEKLVGESSAGLARSREEGAGAETEQSELSRAEEQAREELSEARSRVQRAAAELAALLREAARESDLELEQAEPEAPAALVQFAGRVTELLNDSLADAPVESFPQTLEAASQKSETLRREVLALGTINAEAPEEYRLLSDRYDFLTAQLDDLRRAERTLRKAIEDLRHVMRVRFQEAFDQVNAEFGRCFSTLFGGGSARLALTQPDQPLEGGVEIVATPPGRKGGSLLGLSGGERALTAVALLFALMKVNPSPFCLLDEVDAALDESNVSRFCHMVRQLAGNTQFLLITHNRTTMEMANALYGISMSADSTSRVMSLKLASREN